jgi:hypothetical protein
VTCKFVDLGGGATAIVCSRGQRPKMCACGRRSTKLCDFPLTGKAAGRTCDRPVCDAHAHRQGAHESGPHKGDSIDYCQAHHELALKGTVAP